VKYIEALRERWKKLYTKTGRYCAKMAW